MRFSIVGRVHVFTVWIWLIPPWMKIEKVTLHDWPTHINDYPRRRLGYHSTYPFIRVQDVPLDEYDKEKAFLSRQLYPKEPLERTKYWEGFPGFGWGDILTNTRIIRLRHFNGTLQGIRDAEKDYLGNAETLNITLALLATVEIAALAIPGIETAHWLTRTFWIGGATIAVCGVFTGAVIPKAFHIFWGEDIYPPTQPENHQWLTLQTNAPLLHQIDGLLLLPALVIAWATVLFIAGIITFTATVTFEVSTKWAFPRGLFVVVSLAPSLVYMSIFWYSFIWCSIQHRKFRNRAKMQ